MNELQGVVFGEHRVKAIMKRVRRSGECWYWTGQEQRGNAYIFRRGVQYSLKRVLFYLSHGRIDDTKAVLNTCGDKNCINPDHHSQLKNVGKFDLKEMIL